MLRSAAARSVATSFGGVRKPAQGQRVLPRDIGFAVAIGFCAVPVGALMYFNTPILEFVTPHVRRFRAEALIVYDDTVATLNSTIFKQPFATLNPDDAIRLRLMTKEQRDAASRADCVGRDSEPSQSQPLASDAAPLAESHRLSGAQRQEAAELRGH
jgi:hypothetical protein